jgi:hypothetical protein
MSRATGEISTTTGVGFKHNGTYCSIMCETQHHYARGTVADPVADFSLALIETPSEWGPLRRARNPGSVAGLKGKWTINAGSLGRHPAEFGPV